MQVDEATLGLRRQLITQGPNHTTVRVYHQLMVDTALLLGAKNKSQVEAEMWDVIALEAQIAHATHDPQMGEKKQSWYLFLKAFADVANQVGATIFCFVLRFEILRENLFSLVSFCFCCRCKRPKPCRCSSVC